MSDPITSPVGSAQRWGIVVVAVGMAAVVLSALGFQHIGGYVPCKLCLAQREPYYFAIPIAFIGVLAAWRNGPPYLVRGTLAIAGVAMLYSLVLAIHHSGVEWSWWPGPTDCGAVADGVSSRADDLFANLAHTKAPSCDQAAGRFVGLSFAGWNAVASAGLAAIALWAGFGRARG